jgi:glycosyltransferase involved in cell wall biosynthesis
LEAVARLIREVPDVVWVLAGPDGGEGAHLSRRIAETGLGSHVLRTGALSRRESLEALADADVFLLTSRHEAHSVAMNEALALGVPVVLTDTVQFELVSEYGAGYVVPRTAEAVAGALAGILQQPSLAARMKDAARRLTAEHLAWPRVAAATVEAYREIGTLHRRLQPHADAIVHCQSTRLNQGRSSTRQ